MLKCESFITPLRKKLCFASNNKTIRVIQNNLNIFRAIKASAGEYQIV
jgi:hypothetical protein